MGLWVSTVGSDGAGANEVRSTDDQRVEEYAERLRPLLGRLVTIEETGRVPYNQEATPDTINHYAWGAGDLNPLWVDEAYARRSRYGTVLAPPTFPYSVTSPSLATWLDKPPHDFNAVYGGTSWEFRKLVVLGDRLHATARLADIYTKTTRTVGPMVVLVSETTYWNQRCEPVAAARGLSLRYLRERAAFGGRSESHGTREPRLKITPDVSPDLACSKVRRQGKVPLYWEEVSEGQPVASLFKGMFTMTEMVRWNAGCLGPPRIGAWLDENGRFVNAAHYDPDIAREMGLSGPFDNGPLRGAWLSQLVTDWMGDWGDLLHLEYKILRLNIVGDVNTCKGFVARKWLENGDGTVELEVRVENQDNEITASGKATVRLPAKRHSPGC